VSPLGADAGEPDVAVDPAFGVAVAWTVVDAAGNGTVRLAVSPTGGSFPTAQTAPGGGDGSSPQLAVTTGGALRLAWVRTDAQDAGSALVDDADGGALSPSPAVVSGSDDVTAVRLAYAPSGDGVAVWRRALDPNNEDIADVRAAGFEASGPQLLDLAIPVAANVGTPASFSVRAVDVWSAVAGVSWVFGDGGTANGSQVSHTYATAGVRPVAVQAVDAVGNASSAGGSIDVRPAGAPLPPPPPPPPPPPRRLQRSRRPRRGCAWRASRPTSPASATSGRARRCRPQASPSRSPSRRR
jgi:PKD domain